MNIQITNKSLYGNYHNTGSSSRAVTYSEHELRERPELYSELGVKQDDLVWFDMKGNHVSGPEIVESIGRLHGHLGRNDAKFYCMMISPSDEEAAAMGNSAAEQLSRGHEYVMDVMDAYAKNYHHRRIKDRHDLVAFAIPHIHKSKGKRQVHWHAIIARKDTTNQYKLSPLTNHRNTSKGVVTGGFDRIAFDAECERLFDQRFLYKRRVENSFKYCLAEKKGTLEEKVAQEDRLALQNASELEAVITAAMNHRIAQLASEASERADRQRQAEREEALRLEKEKRSQDLQQLETQHRAALQFDFKAARRRAESASSAGRPEVRERQSVDLLSVFLGARDRQELDRSLLSKRAVVNPVIDRYGGVCDFDVTLAEEGKVVKASALVSDSQMRRMLDKWESLTGQPLAYKQQIDREHWRKLIDICSKMDAVNPLEWPRIPKGISFLPGGGMDITFTVSRDGKAQTLRVDSAGKLRFNGLIMDTVTGEAVPQQRGPFGTRQPSHDESQESRRENGVKIR